MTTLGSLRDLLQEPSREEAVNFGQRFGGTTAEEAASDRIEGQSNCNSVDLGGGGGGEGRS